MSGNFPDCQETFQAVWKFSRLNGNFPDWLETFQPVWKLSSLSGNFPDSPETFQTLQKLSRLYKIFQMVWNILKLIHSYVDVLALFYGQFCKYAQKLSGRAKTFRSAMPTRRRGFWDSGVSEGRTKPIQEMLAHLKNICICNASSSVGCRSNNININTTSKQENKGKCQAGNVDKIL